jgi:hypothetical protein
MIRPLLLGLALVSVAAAPALAETKKELRKETRRELKDGRITPAEAKALRSYYKFQRQANKANKEDDDKRSALPDHWRKQLDKGWVMDPALLAASTPVPADVVKQLGSQPEGTSLVRLRDRVVRIDTDKKILDVIDLTLATN